MVEAALAIGVIGAIIILGVLLTRVAEKTKFPTILALILLGIILGPVFGLFDPLQFGEITKGIVLFALIVVLFNAGFDIKIRDMLRQLAPSLKLTVVAMGLSVLVAMGLAILVLGFDWKLALLLGIILSSTDITTIAPMMKIFRIKPRIRNILNIEAAINSVIAILLATILVTFINQSDGATIFSTGHTFVFKVILGIALGIFLGYLLVFILRHLKVEIRPEILTVGAILLIYSLSEFVGASGIFAVFIAGIVMGNTKKSLKKLMKFESTIALLLVIFVYVILGSILKLNFLASVGLFGVLLCIAVFLSRIPAAWMETKKWNAESEFIFLSGPRGMTVVVMALFFMDYFPNPGFILGIVFVIILLTISAASLSRIFSGKEIEQKPIRKHRDKVGISMKNVFKDKRFFKRSI